MLTNLQLLCIVATSNLTILKHYTGLKQMEEWYKL